MFFLDFQILFECLSCVYMWILQVFVRAKLSLTLTSKSVECNTVKFIASIFKSNLNHLDLKHLLCVPCWKTSCGLDGLSFERVFFPSAQLSENRSSLKTGLSEVWCRWAHNGQFESILKLISLLKLLRNLWSSITQETLLAVSGNNMETIPLENLPFHKIKASVNFRRHYQEWKCLDSSSFYATTSRGRRMVLGLLIPEAVGKDVYNWWRVELAVTLVCTLQKKKKERPYVL